jgi:ABC-type multidrug transport system fused ATPase/permease subunit
MSDASLLERDDDVIRAAVWDLPLLTRMLRYAKPYWRRVLAGLGFVAISSGLFVLPPLLIGALVDAVFGAGDGLPARAISDFLSAVVPGLPDGGIAALAPVTRLWFFAGLFFVARVLTFFVDWGNGYLLAVLGQKVVFDIRTQVFRHIHALDLAFFHRSPVGRLVTRTTNDVGAVEELFSVALVTILKDIGMLAGITTVLLVVNFRLGLVALSVVPPIILATLIFRAVSRAAWRRWRAAISRLNAFLAESLSGVRVVKLFGREARNDRRYDEIGGEYRYHFLKQRRAWAVFRPVHTTISAAGIGIVLWLGGAQAIGGAISVGVLVSFLSYVELFFHPIRDLTEKFDVLQGAMTAGERIFSVLDVKASVVDPPGAVPAGRIEGRVEFRGVSFAYRPGEPVLSDVSFAVAPGERIAIVGHTGAGKTTVVSLLSRFYDVSAGAVLVDGRDVREYALASLRENIAVVHQDVFLFAGSVIENLRLCDESIPADRVRDACRRVAAAEFVERLPGGYDHVLEEAGKTLSAGERQLLSFARALTFDPAILVLDEATSNVDSRTEERIQEAIEKLTRGRTSLVIAHRLSTIRKADRILVFDRGRIIEAGTHAELLARGGAYLRLCRMQFGSD